MREREGGREDEKEQVGRGTIESGAKRVREWGEREIKNWGDRGEREWDERERERESGARGVRERGG